ncbi:uncharacterized protein MKK02DRAFT_39773 [Dioszegia hungarica]|uniref:Uncharacterized protein n=1 Tax=Dioszegia hungarica TaxID=4972 RepID=A0AA38HHS1_9TREE|nr:uncharacterized protein MKK02DRAFT_39773 [Dioszegia hungarica]KAI9639474.1 hypothetical protein MKK02DRAFT_39773 [Dioszegia hungarica]
MFNFSNANSSTDQSLFVFGHASSAVENVALASSPTKIGGKAKLTPKPKKPTTKLAPKPITIHNPVVLPSSSRLFHEEIGNASSTTEHETPRQPPVSHPAADTSTIIRRALEVHLKRKAECNDKDCVRCPLAQILRATLGVTAPPDMTYYIEELLDQVTDVETDLTSLELPHAAYTFLTMLISRMFKEDVELELFNGRVQIIRTCSCGASDSEEQAIISLTVPATDAAGNYVRNLYRSLGMGLSSRKIRDASCPGMNPRCQTPSVTATTTIIDAPRYLFIKLERDTYEQGKASPPMELDLWDFGVKDSFYQPFATLYLDDAHHHTAIYLDQDVMLYDDEVFYSRDTRYRGKVYGYLYEKHPAITSRVLAAMWPLRGRAVMIRARVGKS